MIKKFETFDIEERFINFIKEAFVDFIDEDIFNVDVINYAIWISIKLPFFSDDDFLLSNISKVIDINKKQIEFIEEVRVAILRIKDEFGVEPKMHIKMENIEGDNADDEYQELILNIRYNRLSKN